jgi:hypothetical protein
LSGGKTFCRSPAFVEAGTCSENGGTVSTSKDTCPNHAPSPVTTNDNSSNAGMYSLLLLVPVALGIGIFVVRRKQLCGCGVPKSTPIITATAGF